METENKKKILERLKAKGRIYIPDFDSLEKELESELENEILKNKVVLQHLIEEKEQLKTMIHHLVIT